jgi:type IV pilus assembly protein PilW
MQNKQQGFSLIELMVAMVIGVIVLLGLVSLFSNTSILNRAQTGLSLLQENGRYAISRLKQDIELAGKKHCSTMTLPVDVITDWNQGYEMNAWSIDRSVNFTNGFPRFNQIMLDDVDNDQLPNNVDLASLFPPDSTYPLDPSYFIRGHECNNGICDPDVDVLGADSATDFRTVGVSDDNRADNTDILTVRYLTGGHRVTGITGNVVTVGGEDTMNYTDGDALIGDCVNTYVADAAWGSDTVTFNGNTDLPSLSTLSDTRVYNMDVDFKTVSYFVGISDDENEPGRMISSLYRSENGEVQQLVEGVDRFDVFYLAQLQTGHVARLTADQVHGLQGGGDEDGNGRIDSEQGCIIQPTTSLVGGLKLANGTGCLWRSIYAIEIHLLMNTVNDSSVAEDDRFIYSPDGNTPQSPENGLASGLEGERMYRREFSAIVPIRSYTL